MSMDCRSACSLRTCLIGASASAVKRRAYVRDRDAKSPPDTTRHTPPQVVLGARVGVVVGLNCAATRRACSGSLRRVRGRRGESKMHQCVFRIASHAPVRMLFCDTWCQLNEEHPWFIWCRIVRALTERWLTRRMTSDRATLDPLSQRAGWHQ